MTFAPLARSADAQVPVVPFDTAQFFSMHKVFPDGGPGTREIPVSNRRRVANAGGKINIGVGPLLTLRDVEQIKFGEQHVSVPEELLRERSFTGRLTYTEWGARRRAQAERTNKTGQLAYLQEGSVERVNAVQRSLSMGREEFMDFRGTLNDLAEFDQGVQAALKTIHGQPIRVFREGGERELAPGWKLEATPTGGAWRLQVAGPQSPRGKPWAASAELPCERGAEFIVCWETKCCVLWAASAQSLVAIHFDPDGDGEVTVGEREETLRFQDAPASVRHEIEQVFPPRDGDPATRFGSIAGSVILAGKPAANIEVIVYTHDDADFHDGEHFAAQTDANGGFEFPKVHAPAGVQISIEPMKFRHPNTGRNEPLGGPSLCFHSHLKKNEKLEFTLGGEGQPVVGRIVDAAGPARDWAGCKIEFVLVPASSRTLTDLRAERGLGSAFAEAYENFIKSEQGRAYAPGPQALNADGTFRINRLPAAGYWIYVRPDGAAEARRVKALHMSLLPGGTSDTPLDLGELIFSDSDVAPF